MMMVRHVAEVEVHRLLLRCLPPLLVVAVVAVFPKIRTIRGRRPVTMTLNRVPVRVGDGDVSGPRTVMVMVVMAVEAPQTQPDVATVQIPPSDAIWTAMIWVMMKPNACGSLHDGDADIRRTSPNVRLRGLHQ